MFRKFRSALVRGLVVVLPIGFTIWLLWWIGSSTEALLRRLILLVVPPEHYLPGMGIAAALVLLLAAGTLFNALLVQSALASLGALPRPHPGRQDDLRRDAGLREAPADGRQAPRPAGASCSRASARRR